MVTAKDKLRTLLGNGLDFSSGRAIAFSSEKADKATLAENGIAKVTEFVGKPVPEVYSADLSEFVLAAGAKLLESFRPDLMYLSTTDYVQHKAAPGSKIANEFYAMLDRYVGLHRRAKLRARAHRRSRHERQAQARPLARRDLSARSVRPLGRRGQGARHLADHRSLCRPSRRARLLRHHLSAARRGCCGACEEARGASKAIALVLSNAEAASRFELPPDRIGDLVVLSTRHKVLGTSASRHDLSGLTEPLRSHGGLTEQTVPMIVNRKVDWPQAASFAIMMSSPSRSIMWRREAKPLRAGRSRETRHDREVKG